MGPPWTDPLLPPSPRPLRNRHECEVVAAKLRQEATDLLAKMSSELVGHVQEVCRCGPVASHSLHSLGVRVRPPHCQAD